MYDSGDEDVLVARVTTQRHVTEADYKIADWQICGLLAEIFHKAGASRRRYKIILLPNGWVHWNLEKLPG